MFRVLPFFWALFAARIHAHITNDRGATAVEYGLLVALIALAIIAAVTALGQDLSGMFQTIADNISGATS